MVLLIRTYCGSDIEAIRDYHPWAIHSYDRLTLTTKIVHPTILSAFKAGLLGPQIPLLPFAIEVTNTRFPHPILCRIDPSSPSWDQDVYAQAGRILGMPSAVIVNETGQSLSLIGLDQVWTNRRTVSYRAETRSTTIVQQRATGPSDLFVVSKRRTDVEQGLSDDYINETASCVEDRISTKLFSILEQHDPSEWSEVLAGLQQQSTSLQFVNDLIMDPGFVHVYDGRCIHSVLTQCGFKTPVIFVRRLRCLFSESLCSLRNMILSASGTIKCKIMMARFRAQLRAYRLGCWMRSIRNTCFHRNCEVHAVTGIVRYNPCSVSEHYVSSGPYGGAYTSSSSEGEDVIDPLIFERPQPVSSGIMNPGKDAIFLGAGINDQEDIGALRLSNVFSPGSVSFRLLRRDDFVRKYRNTSPTADVYPDAKDFQKFSMTGNTLVEPGDLIQVTVRKASSEPIDPAKKRTTRSMAFLRRAGRNIKRSLSPSGKSKPSATKAADQYVRLDWVVYNKSIIRRAMGQEYEWRIVSTYRLKRGAADYQGPGFVVPLKPDVRYAVFIYENALGTENQWIYQGMRVFDIMKGPVSKKTRTVMFDKNALNAYINSMPKSGNPYKYTDELSRARYVGYPPYLRRTPDTNDLVDIFPVFVGDPKKRVVISPCLENAWSTYEKAIGGNPDFVKNYWAVFLNAAAYPKMRRIANVIYQLAREKPPFPTEKTYTGVYGVEEAKSAPVMSKNDCVTMEPTQGEHPLSMKPSAEVDETYYSSSGEENEEPPPMPVPVSPSSTPQVSSPVPARDESVSVDKDGFTTDTYTVSEDYVDAQTGATWKKGTKILVNKDSYMQDYAWVSDFNEQSRLVYLPVKAIQEPLPQGWPNIIPYEEAQPVGPKIAVKQSDYSRYNQQLQAARDRTAHSTEKSRVRSFTRSAKLGCPLCGKIKRKKDRRGIPTTPIDEEIGCVVCGGKSKKKKQQTTPPTSSTSSSSPPIEARLSTNSIHVFSPDKHRLFSVLKKEGMTIQDLIDETARQGFPETDYVLTNKKMKVFVPSDDVAVLKGDHAILYPRRLFNELVVVGAVPDSTSPLIGDLLDAVVADAAAPVGKHMKGHKEHKKEKEHKGHKDSKKDRYKHSKDAEDSSMIEKKLSKRHKGAGQSTTYYSSNPHNIIAETGSDMVLSDIKNPVSLVGLSRNLMNETPISTEHVLTRCKAVARTRRARGDTTDYSQTLEKLELAFSFFHCVNTGRVRIFRRTIHGGCDESIFTALRLGELQPIGEDFNPELPHLPEMAFDVNALYFLRAPYAAIDNNKIFDRVLDDPDRFLDALGFVVLQGKEMPDAETVAQIAKECYQKHQTIKKPLPPLTPMPECGWNSLWQKLTARTRYYTPNPLTHDDALDTERGLPYNQTYGSLQGLPNAIPTIGDEMEEPVNPKNVPEDSGYPEETDPEAHEGGSSSASSTESQPFSSTSGFEEAESGGFGDYDPEAYESTSSETPATSMRQVATSTPAPSPVSLRKAQDNVPTPPRDVPSQAQNIDLVAVVNGEEFTYTPRDIFMVSPGNFKSETLVTDEMTLEDLLKALSDALYNDYRIRIGVPCMVVRIGTSTNLVIKPEVYEQVKLNDRTLFVNTPSIVLHIKDGHEYNAREPISSAETSSPSSSSSEASIMAELLDLKTFDDKSDPIGDCVYLEDEHKNFNAFWGRAVADKSGIFFGSCPEHTNPIFTPETQHVVVVPKPTMFSRFCNMFVRKEMQFRDFVRAHTFPIHSGFQSINREQTIQSIDGSRSVNLKYQFRPSQNQGFVRVNDTWVPIRRLNLGPGRENYNVYALPYDQQL